MKPLEYLSQFFLAMALAFVGMFCVYGINSVYQWHKDVTKE